MNSAADGATIAFAKRIRIMVASIRIECPECHRQVNAPARVQGKKVRCKYCQAVFVARGGAGKPPAGKSAKPAKPAKPAALDDEEEGGANPYGVTGLDLTPRCPHCANEMEEGDVICLHCGYNTQTRQRAQMRKIYDLTFGEHFLWLLPGIACLLVVLGLIGFNVWYHMNITEMIDTSEGSPDPWYVRMWASGPIRFWVTVVSLFILWYTGKYAFKRLVLHPKPPEVEKLK